MVGRKKVIVDGKKTLLLVTESEAERAYFLQMRKDLRYSSMSVISPQKTLKWKDLIDFAARERIKGGYALSYVVFGTDEASLDAKDIEGMREAAEKRNVKVLYFVPSFSLYFVLFKEVPKVGDDPALRAKELYDGYDETAEYLNGKGESINREIYPKLMEAERNAEALNKKSREVLGYDSTSLSEFLIDLKSTLGVGDMSQTKKF